MDTARRTLISLRNRAIVGVLLSMLLLLVGIQIARAAEIIPAVGISKPADGDGDARTFGSLAVRGNLLPILKTEVAVAYRQESMFDDQLKVRMWPVTTSLWLAPIPALYAGAGVGWYHTTLDYDEDRVPSTVATDDTRQEFGVHVGGGLQVPIAPRVGLDLHGRYVMMREQDSRLVPERFDPDFWSTSLGLAISF
jgi:hypothetical protein